MIARQNKSTISTYDAKSLFSQMLDRVEHGEELTITRHGKPVARLLPVNNEQLAMKRASAIARMLIRRKYSKLKGTTIMDLVREGREARK